MPTSGEAETEDDATSPTKRVCSQTHTSDAYVSEAGFALKCVEHETTACGKPKLIQVQKRLR